MNYLINNDTYIHVCKFLNYHEISKFDKSRNTFCKFMSEHKLSNKVIYGLYNNYYKKCFYCPNDLSNNCNINLCSCFNIPENNTFSSYPYTCTNCTSYINRGNQIKKICKLCGQYSIHLGISFLSF